MEKPNAYDRNGVWLVVRSLSLAVVVALCIALSGCFQGFQEIVQSGPQSTRAFTCAVLSEAPMQDLRIEVLVDDAVDFSPVAPVDRLRTVLGEHTGKVRDNIQVRIQSLEETPEDGWTDDGWEEALRGHTYAESSDTVVLRVYWLAALPAPWTGDVPAPGVVALDHQALGQKAETLGWDMDTTATALLLHHVGHALGVVNRGVPMQENHEGTPQHSSDPGSVMHASWDDPLDATVAPNGTYDDYGAAVVADWDAARTDERVCP